MSIRGIVRMATIGTVVYGAVKAVEFVGVCKGVVVGCRAAFDDPETAKRVIADWDYIEARLSELKAQCKKA